MTSSTGKSWNDDQVDELLTKFYTQETPAAFRCQSAHTERAEVARRKRGPKNHLVVAGLVVLCTATAGWLTWSSWQSVGSTVALPMEEPSQSPPSPTSTAIRDAQESTPVETIHRIEPARLTDSETHPGSELPEWEIQVFPIDEEKPRPPIKSPAVAEPAVRRSSR
ncbi:hypothetical protein [Thalassoroseus pseudoceratinae]|uniref:hypothetical protein n=1 Tax=Thalassoroseus pseudoceratinae TaxID=2713176 RepID=UPI00142013DE|nr:hypothetical protein [Thalassoroseus pseudoceratinae]